MDSASQLSVFWCLNVHSNLVRRSLCVIRLRLARFSLLLPVFVFVSFFEAAVTFSRKRGTCG